MLSVSVLTKSWFRQGATSDSFFPNHSPPYHCFNYALYVPMMSV